MSNTNVSKREIRQLATEHQEAIAAFKLSEVRNRQHLLELARGSAPRSWFPVVAPGLMMLALMIPVFIPIQKYYPLGLIAVIACPVIILSIEIISHQRRLNGRLDALLKLLELEKKDREHGAQSGRQE